MGCEALHSHLLFGLMVISIIHAVIVMYLFSSKMFFVFPKKSTLNTTMNVVLGKEEYDLNGVKVIIGIIAHCLCFVSFLGSLLANNVKTLTRKLPPVVITVTLVFSLVINVAGAFCLWFHYAPHHPGGFSRTVRGSAILSSMALVVTLGISVLFCIHPPPHESLRATPSAEAIAQEVGATKEKKESKDKKTSWFKRKEVPAEPTPMDVPVGEKKPSDGEGLYENLEVPPGEMPLPPPPPP
ncbi:hypothetical protein ANCCAN_02752 [Ancylostoma caninum]|uniref:Transmembrane protein n=1 Tax=Ancylostoma caninum TaxID=29170 RepID=A0A368H3J9_ANCCA|nr:hypothetical protein ANCCAN_02752 [Ancylostoma caninum]